MGHALGTGIGSRSATGCGCRSWGRKTLASTTSRRSPPRRTSTPYSHPTRPTTGGGRHPARLPRPTTTTQVGAARGRRARIVPPVPRLPGLECAGAAGRRCGTGRSRRTAPRVAATRERVSPGTGRFRIQHAARRSRPLSRDRTRCPRCPASRGTTRCRHRQAVVARVPRRARPVVRIRPQVRPGALHPRARCRPARQDAADS